MCQVRAAADDSADAPRHLPALGTDYYVAPTGSDSNPGTLDEPFATLQEGADVAAAGDTVYIRGGTYSITTPTAAGAGIRFTKSGTSDTNWIRYWAYEGDTPVFDFSKLVISTTGYTHGFVVSGSWLHFKGLEICNVPMNSFSKNGVAVDAGSHDIFGLLNMHHNNGNGIFIGKGTGGHLVLNCDAHDNYDPTSNQGDGQNADGFGVHYQTSGDVTTIRGCRAWCCRAAGGSWPSATWTRIGLLGFLLLCRRGCAFGISQAIEQRPTPAPVR
ncbi:MAG: hypothetical protein JW940_11515 [Polyangiaceae bacterium]|nr:hypothetical protein [Polyangiaceae bacterium]